MKSMFNRTLAVLVGMLLYEAGASAQPAVAMKLLTPQVGWVQSDLYHLYWTTDGGAHWKDIAPPRSATEYLTGVFFLDSSSGWVVLGHGDKQDRAQFRVASTSNAGASWSISPIKFPWKRYDDDFAGGAGVFFLDHLHGWMNLDRKSSSSFSIGQLLASDDSGKTWKAPPGSSGEGGFLCFFSEGDGLFSGGADSSELWATHDGSKSWQQLSPRVPLSISPAEFPTYDKPTCGPGKRGSLPVTYSGPNGSMSALVLFVTDDAGKTWRPTSVLPKLDETSPGQTVASATVGSTLMAATKSGGTVTLTIVAPSGEVKRIALNGFKEVPELTFVDMSHGWASTYSGTFATTDGGNSWTDITPARTAH